MTITKKGSRQIIVGQESYRWIITPSGRGTLTLTIQHDQVNGQLLRIDINQTLMNSGWSFRMSII